MIQSIAEIIQHGDENGNYMQVRFRLPSGLEVIGLPTKNFYGGYWDLGPTWNYAVLTDAPFLMDTGRYGQGNKLVEMLEFSGVSVTDLEFILISHGHEDHDGGLSDILKLCSAKVSAHSVYGQLVKKYPEKAPQEYKENFPAKCWQCSMPEAFYKEHCLDYHQALQQLEIDSIDDGENEIMPGVTTYHMPGHTPDSLAVMINHEVIIVGDILLPEISPIPTCVAQFNDVSNILGPKYSSPEAIFGLCRYISSLKKLKELSGQYPDLIVLPGHRLYYKEHWNHIDLSNRVNELIEHHVQRCGSIIDILKECPMTASQIAGKHFAQKLLKGVGRHMAKNEIDSHCELLISSGDVAVTDEEIFHLTGKNNFEAFIDSIPII
ncbi:MAG: MBL fold metallo-hydrolase [Deltaproteobacteria bacterium]|nr:MBL fold metallo-hydrolase [Deltaproteobacteria bacterium]MBW1846357.1 MBL fold metallo-hydrolase [Deltaproteobacteria bacterium]MBW2365689.1 MBL fold metallo-hydrolase [Deltaproteobacteria bacterium]